MATSIPITLPSGTWRNGVRHRDALLRPLTGEDELFLVEDAEGVSPARRTTLLLTRCLERLGTEQPVSDAATRALTAGDREALLLHLRRVTFGETLTSVLTCPRAGCDERMDLELRVSELLVDAVPEPAAVHEATIDGRTVRFRLPNGEDLEEVGQTLLSVDAAVREQALSRMTRLVLERCVEGEVDDAIEAQLPRIMAELDPQAELLLNLVCTRCGRPFTALFDAASFLFRELAAHRDVLYRDVHQLALHYHWSESDILAMPAERRRRYLELLAEALTPRGKR
ncbi:MAG TPA: hypothetical protein VGF69_23550 [Thermoanaerobaculia bacterium]|jgi:hypothetical protein